MNDRNIKGIVLAGGKSSRFGADKAMAKLGGITLLERAVNLLKDLELDSVIVAGGLKDYSFLNCRIEKDIFPDQGPLGGFYTACRIFEDSPLLVLTCDMPGVTPAVLETLLRHHEKKHFITVFNGFGGGYQPFPGIYESRFLNLAFTHIQQGQLSMHDFLSAVGRVHSIQPDFEQHVLMNVNEPADLRRRDLTHIFS